MNPQDVASFAEKIGDYFKDIAPAERELVRTILEKFSSSTAEAVIPRYVEETATFDRGKLFTLLREEHCRRTPRMSPTAGWKNAKDAEAEAINEFLSKIPNGRLQRLIDNLRKEQPALFSFLRSDPLGTDIGRSLIYDQLKNQRAKCGVARVQFKHVHVFSRSRRCFGQGMTHHTIRPLKICSRTT